MFKDHGKFRKNQANKEELTARILIAETRFFKGGSGI